MIVDILKLSSNYFGALEFRVSAFYKLLNCIKSSVIFKFNFTDQPVLTLRISSDRDLSTAYDMLNKKLLNSGGMIRNLFPLT